MNKALSKCVVMYKARKHKQLKEMIINMLHDNRTIDLKCYSFLLLNLMELNELDVVVHVINTPELATHCLPGILSHLLNKLKAAKSKQTVVDCLAVLNKTLLLILLKVNNEYKVIPSDEPENPFKKELFMMHFSNIKHVFLPEKLYESVNQQMLVVELCGLILTVELKTTLSVYCFDLLLRHVQSDFEAVRNDAKNRALNVQMSYEFYQLVVSHICSYTFDPLLVELIASFLVPSEKLFSRFSKKSEAFVKELRRLDWEPIIPSLIYSTKDYYKLALLINCENHAQSLLEHLSALNCVYENVATCIRLHEILPITSLQITLPHLLNSDDYVTAIKRIYSLDIIEKVKDYSYSNLITEIQMNLGFGLELFVIYSQHYEIDESLVLRVVERIQKTKYEKRENVRLLLRILSVHETFGLEFLTTMSNFLISFYSIDRSVVKVLVNYVESLPKNMREINFCPLLHTLFLFVQSNLDDVTVRLLEALMRVGGDFIHSKVSKILSRLQKYPSLLELQSNMESKHQDQ